MEHWILFELATSVASIFQLPPYNEDCNALEIKVPNTFETLYSQQRVRDYHINLLRAELQPLPWYPSWKESCCWCLHISLLCVGGTIQAGLCSPVRLSRENSHHLRTPRSAPCWVQYCHSCINYVANSNTKTFNILWRLEALEWWFTGSWCFFGCNADF